MTRASAERVGPTGRGAVLNDRPQSVALVQKHWLDLTSPVVRGTPRYTTSLSASVLCFKRYLAPR